MIIKKSPLMAGLLTLNAFLASMTAKAYEGEIDVKTGVFGAPIDKVLGVSNGFVSTYRSQAKYTYQTKEVKQVGWDMNQNPIYGDPETVVKTNSAPYVRVALDGSRGFASGKAIEGFTSDSFANEDTGVITTADENGNVFVSTPSKSGLGGFSTTTNKLVQAVNAEKPVTLVNPIAYMYDDEHMIVFSEYGASGRVTRATKVDDQFVVTKQNGREHAPYRPTMATQSKDNVYFSDGTSIISYSAKNLTDATRTDLLADGVVKDMAVAGGKLFWTTGTELYCEGTPSVFNLNGAQMTGLVSDGSKLYVGNTNGVSYTTSLGGVPVQYVDQAAQLVTSRENNQTLIYRMYQNKVELVNQ